MDGVAPEIDHEVVSAFSEAFNNVVIHAYRGRPVREIEIEIELDEATLTIHVRDYGSSFDPSNVPDPDLDTMPEGGLGLYIIRSFMDDVRYHAGAPNVLTMTKHLTAHGAYASRATESEPIR
jgi:serine/threonine-protein kinase RsbW